MCLLSCRGGIFVVFYFAHFVWSHVLDGAENPSIHNVIKLYWASMCGGTPQMGAPEGEDAREGISHEWASSQTVLMGGGAQWKPRGAMWWGEMIFPMSATLQEPLINWGYYPISLGTYLPKGDGVLMVQEYYSSTQLGWRGILLLETEFIYYYIQKLRRNSTILIRTPRNGICDHGACSGAQCVGLAWGDERAPQWMVNSSTPASTTTLHGFGAQCRDLGHTSSNSLVVHKSPKLYSTPHIGTDRDPSSWIEYGDKSP